MACLHDGLDVIFSGGILKCQVTGVFSGKEVRLRVSLTDRLQMWLEGVT